MVLTPDIIISDILKKYNSKNRNIMSERGMKVLITDHVFRISDKALIA